MSIPDQLITKYFDLVTDLSFEEKNKIRENLNKGNLHPRDAKMLLAKTIVRMYHGSNKAEEAEMYFKDVFQRNSLPENIPLISWSGKRQLSIIHLLVELNLLESKSAARKMIQNGGVRLNQKKVTDMNLIVKLEDGLIVQVGKRKIIQITLK